VVGRKIGNNFYKKPESLQKTPPPPKKKTFCSVQPAQITTILKNMSS